MVCCTIVVQMSDNAIRSDNVSNVDSLRTP